LATGITKASARIKVNVLAVPVITPILVAAFALVLAKVVVNVATFVVVDSKVVVSVATVVVVEVAVAFVIPRFVDHVATEALVAENFIYIYIYINK
jgi:hypothetical protein